MGAETTFERAITVLVVDDHTMVLESLVRLLSDEPGVTVVGTAASGGEAVAEAARLQPDVVVMDYVLPDMDGVAAAGRARVAAPSARIVILTGSDVDEVPFAAAASG